MSFCGTSEDRHDQGNAAKQKPEVPCDGGVTPCPKKCKPIDAVKILSVTFLSDHGLLTDHDSDWGNGGSVFAKPHWTPVRTNPVSHTMDKEVELELSFEVTPADACPETGDLLGTAPDGISFEAKGVSFSAGQQTLRIKSSGKLAKKIQELAFQVQWTAKGVSVAPSPSSTSHTLFVTMGTPVRPRWPDVTIKRMRQAVGATGAAGSLDPHAIVKNVMSKWSAFNLAQVYGNEWELAGDARDPLTGDLIGADCQTIVRYTESAIRMVGCPGTAEFIVVWAKVAAPAKGIENPAYTPNVSSPKQWHNANRPAVAARARWRATLLDHGGGQNRYEACLKFTHAGVMRYYAGGVGALNDVDQVIHVFKTMSWREDDTGAIMGTIHTY